MATSGAELIISRQTQRQFVLGRQGLWPGRRWAGAEGVAAAIRADCVVQIDPLNVVARSHDIALYGRVHDYQPADLERLLYVERAAFDYGGTVMVYPMEELPCWRVVMARKGHEARWNAFAAQYGETIAAVRAAVQAHGPLGTRDLAGARVREGSFRSGKVTGQALYYLWLTGELMTHSRRGFDRVYDLRERIAPTHLDYVASEADADAYFARKVLRQRGIATLQRWRAWFAGMIERKVDQNEAIARVADLCHTGAIAEIGVEGQARTPYFVLAEDVPTLAALQAGQCPPAWQPLAKSTADEVVFLAPLEIVSTRGRALLLFDFEYLWEVYKPEAKRRWGYYTLPILYDDRLVARLDPKLDRASRILLVKGFWLELDTVVDPAFAAALAAGLRRFMHFVGADTVVPPPTLPSSILAAVLRGD